MIPKKISSWMVMALVISIGGGLSACKQDGGGTVTVIASDPAHGFINERATFMGLVDTMGTANCLGTAVKVGTSTHGLTDLVRDFVEVSMEAGSTPVGRIATLVGVPDNVADDVTGTFTYAVAADAASDGQAQGGSLGYEPDASDGLLTFFDANNASATQRLSGAYYFKPETTVTVNGTLETQPAEQPDFFSSITAFKPGQNTPMLGMAVEESVPNPAAFRGVTYLYGELALPSGAWVRGAFTLDATDNSLSYQIYKCSACDSVPSAVQSGAYDLGTNGRISLAFDDASIDRREGMVSATGDYMVWTETRDGTGDIHVGVAVKQTAERSITELSDDYYGTFLCQETGGSTQESRLVHLNFKTTGGSYTRETIATQDGRTGNAVGTDSKLYDIDVNSNIRLYNFDF
jgi:hypothetical protein